MALARCKSADAGASTPSAATAFLAAMEGSGWGSPAAAAAVPDHPDQVTLPVTAAEAVSGEDQVVLGENANPIFTYRTEHVSTARVLQILTDMTRMSADTYHNPATQTMRTKLRETLGAAHAMLQGRLPCTVAQLDTARTVGRMLCLAVGHTRDIVDGKGERDLAYLLLAEHYLVAPGLAVGMVQHLVRFHGAGDGASVECKPLATGHQYGSWADVKRLAAFVRDHYGATIEHPLVQEALRLMAVQLSTDIVQMSRSAGGGYSLAARWSPKATGSSKWLFRTLALMVYPFHQTATTAGQLEAAGRKAERTLRQQLSALNRLIKTVEVLMSSEEHEWHTIEFGSLPSQALRRHVRAWKNTTKRGDDRFADSADRAECAEHYATHMSRVASGEATVKGARCGPGELVNDVRHSGDDDARINGQWAAKLAELPGLGKCLTMVDVSGSMDMATIPGSKIRVMDAAIGIGLMVAAKSEPPFNNKTISFATDPSFVSYRADMTFTDRVRHTLTQQPGYSTDFRKACRELLNVALEANMGPEFFADFVLFVLSDMQINCGSAQWSPDLAKEVQTMFADAGRASEHATPFAAPHVVMWNLASTNTMATTEGLVGATSISGYSDSMLKAFEAEGVAGLTGMTPGELLREQLEAPRYAPLGVEWANYIG